MSKEEIRHCPMCGGAAKVKYKDRYTWVECKKCHFTSDKYPDYSDEERDPDARANAIEDWNTKE